MFVSSFSPSLPRWVLLLRTYCICCLLCLTYNTDIGPLFFLIVLVHRPPSLVMGYKSSPEKLSCAWVMWMSRSTFIEPVRRPGKRNRSQGRGNVLLLANGFEWKCSSSETNYTFFWMWYFESAYLGLDSRLSEIWSITFPNTFVNLLEKKKPNVSSSFATVCTRLHGLSER